MLKKSASFIIAIFISCCCFFTVFGETYVTFTENEETFCKAESLSVVIAEVNSAEQFDKILAGKRPTAVIFYVDKDLNVTAGKGGTVISALTDAVAKLNLQIMPAFYISDGETADALGDWVKNNKFKDCFIVSSDPELVKRTKTIYAQPHGVIDFRNSDVTDPLTVRNTVNCNMAKIALVPSGYSYENVDWLQKRIITVWMQAEDSEISRLNSIISGANGIVGSDADGIYNDLSKLSDDALLRNPNLIGHRGQPATNHENTLSSAIAAYEAGADAIECDVYFSKDKEIVIMHDSDVSRTTDGTGSISSFTLEELKKLKMDTNPSFPDDTVPTLREYFEYFKDKDVIQVIELKTSDGSIIPALKALIDEYDMSSKVNFISFDSSQLKRAREQMPEISAGLLVSVSEPNDSERSRNAVTSGIMKNNLTYHPSSGAVSKSFISWAKARGISVYPWTVDGVNDYVNIYTLCESITTNRALYASDFGISLENADAKNIKKDKDGNMTVTAELVKRTGTPEKVSCTVEEYEGVYLASYKYKNEDVAGKGVLIEYTLYAAPFTVEDTASEKGGCSGILTSGAAIITAVLCAAVLLLKRKSVKG